LTPTEYDRAIQSDRDKDNCRVVLHGSILSHEAVEAYVSLNQRTARPRVGRRTQTGQTVAANEADGRLVAIAFAQ
jgi:hypothetical protein